MKAGGRGLKAVIAVVLVVVVLLAGLFVAGNIGFPRGRSNGQITQAWLNQEIGRLRPSQNATIGFSAFWQSVSYSNINSVSPTAQEADLTMLVSSGATCIRVDPNYPESAQLAGDLQALRSTGRCLILADAASQSYYSNPLSWTKFQQAWVQRIAAFAAAYHPDYYIVIKEPGWYVPMVSDATTNPQFQNATVWVALTQQLVTAVQQASPTTKIGVSIGADVGGHSQFYNDFLKGVEGIEGLSFIGFDVYNVAAVAYTQTFLSTIGSGDKSVWIAEAWSGTGSVAFDSARADLDKTWMLFLYYFAEYIHAANVIPFFTGIFASYSRTPDYSQRTPVFYEFQTLTKLHGTSLV